MIFLRRAFLTLAVAIVVLHSITPHSHLESTATSISSNTCQAVKSELLVINILQGIFEQDLGAEHLENFASTDQEKLDILLLVAEINSPIALIKALEETIEHEKVFVLSHFDPLFSASHSLRGPPLIA